MKMVAFSGVILFGGGVDISLVSPNVCTQSYVERSSVRSR